VIELQPHAPPRIWFSPCPARGHAGGCWGGRRSCLHLPAREGRLAGIGTGRRSRRARQGPVCDLHVPVRRRTGAERLPPGSTGGRTVPPVRQCGSLRFDRNGEAWEESFRFVPDDGRVDYLFEKAINIGASVALGGDSDRADLLAVGLPGFADWTGDLGEAWVGANPAQLPEFPPSPRQVGEIYLFARSADGRWGFQVALKPAGWDDPPGPGALFPSFPSHLDEPPDDFDEAAYFDAYIYPGHFFSVVPQITFFGATVDLDGDHLVVTSRDFRLCEFDLPLRKAGGAGPTA